MTAVPHTCGAPATVSEHKPDANTLVRDCRCSKCGVTERYVYEVVLRPAKGTFAHEHNQPAAAKVGE